MSANTTRTETVSDYIPPTVEAVEASQPKATYIPPPADTDEPRVFTCISRVMRDIMPVGKNQVNSHQKYRFRGIDDFMSAVAGPMRKHGVFPVPNVVDHRIERRGGDKMVTAILTIEYQVYGPAGDALVTRFVGEASDTSDKGTNKALSAALKYFLAQTFMIPIDNRSLGALADADFDHIENGPPAPAPARDFLAEARNAETRGKAQRIWREAKAAGAPPEYLEQIVQIGSAKPDTAPGHDRNTALEAMYAAGDAAGMTREEVQQVFLDDHGHDVLKGTVEEIRSTAADIKAAAGA